MFFISTLDPRPDEWKRSLTSYTLSYPRQQHCLTTINNNVFIFGGELQKKTPFINIDFRCLNIGCQKDGEEVQSIHRICRVTNPSSDGAPVWEDLDQELQHSRTDCGYFRLGKDILVVDSCIATMIR